MGLSPTLGAGLMGAGSSILTNLVNMRENRIARQYNTDMWNKQNAYNAPAAQLQRFQDAGLNTNLMYSQGTSGTAGAPPAAQPAHFESSRGDLMATAMQYLQMLIQKEKLKQEQAVSRYAEAIEFNRMNQSSQKNVLNDYAILDKGMLYNDNVDQQTNQSLFMKLKRLELAKGNFDIMKKGKDIELLDKSIFGKELDNQLKSKLNPETIRGAQLKNALMLIQKNWGNVNQIMNNVTKVLGGAAATKVLTRAAKKGS